jgi:hypothetical protein
MVLGLLAFLPAARGQLRVTADASDPSKPIAVAADRALSWTEGNVEVLHFIGHVSIEQGLLRARMKEAVVWLRKTEADNGKPLPVEIYGEGEVVVDRPQGSNETDDRVFLELRTRDDLRLRNQQRVQQSAANDPFYRRALVFRESTGVAKSPPNTAVSPAVAAGASTSSGSDVKQAVVTTDAQNGKPIIQVQEVLPRATPELQTPGTPGGGAPRTPTLPLILPRGSSNYQVKIEQIGNEYRTVITGGVMIFFTQDDGMGIVDIGADRVVMWTRNVDPQKLLPSNSENPQPREASEGHREQIEFYLEGHVEIRQSTAYGREAAVTRLLIADQAYYDVQRSVALIVHGEVITQPHGAPAPVYFRADEIRQTARNRFEATHGQVFSSYLPSDPDLTVDLANATLEERRVPAKGLFGRPIFDANGQPVELTQLWATGEDAVFKFRDVPFFYLPSVEDDLRDPLGPLQNVRIRSDHIFGPGALVDWNLFSLLGANTRPPGTRWTLETDYLSQRGPGIGTFFDTRGLDLFGLPGIYHTEARAYFIYDTGEDNLGGPRKFDPPRDLRDRLLFRHYQEIGEDLTFLGQFAWLSDRNFLEQYYKTEFDNDINQETFVYVKDQHDNWALSILAEPRLRWWVTETQWLPRADGYWLGESFFDRLTYFARANIGFASQRVTSDVSDAFIATPIPDQFDRIRQLPPSSDTPHYRSIDTGRADLWQELDLPLQLGPFKVVPYGLLDLTYYSETLDDTNVGRIYGGGGVRVSIPFTRVYPDVQSQLFNVNGIAHKINFWVDYRYVETNVPFRELPELDRLNDDATDQSIRDLRQFHLNPPPGTITQPNDIFLATSPLYDPQLYALRRGLEYNADTLDDMQTIRFGIDERWQTKRGIPGHEHIIDWMTLNTSATIFPDSQRDNFGHTFGLLQYDYTWHIGDRTTFVSSGWMDPYTNGGKVFSAGMYLDRPDRANFYVGYRSIEPLGVDAMILASTYQFSPKWRATFSTTYDFGATGNLGNALVLSRVGSDLQVNVGFSYSPLQKNFGFTFEIFPTLAATHSGLGSSSSGHGLGR